MAVIVKNFWYRQALWWGPPLFRLLTRLLFVTCRVEHHQREHFDRVEASGRPYIAAFWHYGIVYIVTMSLGLNRKWVAMVSASQDGEYIARVLQVMGYQPVRGSRGKGGLGAVKEMLAWIDKGMSAAIVADGSKGPARRVQAGVILLSSRSGVPILPVAWAAERYIAFRSWDRTVLPKPFSRIGLWYGEPLQVPAELTARDLEHCRLELEQRLNDLYDKAWTGFGKAGH